MLFVLTATLTAMAINLVTFWRQGVFMLLATGAVLFVLAVWLTAEAWLAVRRYRRTPPVETLEVLFPSDR
jgi:carbon starvation protein